jgi:hypothetical protein
MDLQFIFEFIGYAASVLIAISLMMSSILKLRIINLAGAILFTIYGMVIQAYPVAAVNFLIVLIDLYFLYQIYNTREFFRVLQVNQTSDYLRYFLDFYQKEIHIVRPDFNFVPTPTQFIYFILRDMVPAGLVIAEPQANHTLKIQLDFAIPGYRDFKTSRFLFVNKADLLTSQGIQTIFSSPGSPSHEEYLRRIGFHPDGDDQGRPLYRLDLA